MNEELIQIDNIEALFYALRDQPTIKTLLRHAPGIVEACQEHESRIVIDPSGRVFEVELQSGDGGPVIVKATGESEWHRLDEDLSLRGVCRKLKRGEPISDVYGQKL